MRGRMRHISTPIYILMILVLAFATSAQSPPDQDWTKWSSDVCLKILTDSPWVAIAQPQDPKDTRRAVLLSSLLVRQAMLRQMQIHEKYDTMSPKKRQEFDERTSTCLTDPKYSKNIVLRIWGGLVPPKPEGSQHPLQLTVSGRNATMSFIYDAALTCGGDSFPWQYVPTAIDKLNQDYDSRHPAGQLPAVRDNRQLTRPSTYDLFYSRSLNGAPLVQPDDRAIALTWGESPDQFVFHLTDLIYKGKLDF
jgi:hypothetical protein